jgi:hypothetical protein
VENFPNRNGAKKLIPHETMELVAGFTTENVFYNLGGRFRATYRPLNDAIMAGRIRGVAGVVGCDKFKNKGSSHVEMRERSGTTCSWHRPAARHRLREGRPLRPEAHGARAGACGRSAAVESPVLHTAA